MNHFPYLLIAYIAMSPDLSERKATKYNNLMVKKDQFADVEVQEIKVCINLLYFWDFGICPNPLGIMCATSPPPVHANLLQ